MEGDGVEEERPEMVPFQKMRLEKVPGSERQSWKRRRLSQQEVVLENRWTKDAPLSPHLPSAIAPRYRAPGF